MKNYVLVAILIGAALLGYSISHKQNHKHEVQNTIDTAQEAKQKLIEEKEKKQEELIEAKAREITKTTLANLSYEAANGEKCTENCQDANAGYEWAKSQDFNEQSDCGGKTEAYKNGCQVYVDKYDNLLDENKEKLEAAAAEAAKQPPIQQTNQTN